MSDEQPPTDIAEFHCVEEHRVVFYDDLDFIYGRLLDVIRACGYEVFAFGPNRPFEDIDDDEDVGPTDQKSSGETDGRTWAVFIETDEAYDYRDVDFSDPPEWITDVPV